MPKLVTNLSNTSNMGKPVVVPNSAMDNNAIGTHTVMVETTRPQCSLSCTAAIITSRIEISEVTPANSSEPKNSTPSRLPIGAWSIMAGKAINAKPMPDVATSLTSLPPACAIKPNAANTPIPASNSKLLLAKPTTKPEPVKSVSRFK